MERELRILLLEDALTDAQIIEDKLCEAGLAPTIRRVETREDFLQALQARPPDVILADYTLPHFDGRSALRIAKEQVPLVPVIIVTGTMIDETAVELLSEGASDYVLKDRLSRLPDAVRRALERSQLEAARREAEEKYRVLFEEAQDGIALLDCSSDRLVDCNAEFQRQTGRTHAELLGLTLWDLRRPLDEGTEGMLATEAALLGDQFAFHHPDGGEVPVELRANGVALSGRRYIQVISRDVTERRRAELNLCTQLEELRRFQKVAVDRELQMEKLEEELQCLRSGCDARKCPDLLTD